MATFKWSFYYSDSEGKAHRFDIRAVSSTEAILKGFTRARKHSGDGILNWNCCLKTVF